LDLTAPNALLPVYASIRPFTPVEAEHWQTCCALAAPSAFLASAQYGSGSALRPERRVDQGSEHFLQWLKKGHAKVKK